MAEIFQLIRAGDAAGVRALLALNRRTLELFDLGDALEIEHPAEK